MDTFLFTTIPIELEQQIAQTVLAKRTMNKIINEIDCDCIISWYLDGEGSSCPYYLYEYNCTESED